MQTAIYRVKVYIVLMLVYFLLSIVIEGKKIFIVTSLIQNLMKMFVRACTAFEILFFATEYKTFDFFSLKP